MIRIALVNQKGGVGKSTTAVNLSAGLARLGKRVLLIDLDPQAHATVALGLDPRRLDKTIYTLFAGAAKPAEVIRTVQDRLSIIPANIHLAGGEAELAAMPEAHSVMKRAMRDLDPDAFDVVIVDSPPQLGFLNVNSLAYVNEVYIPVTCEFYALHGLSLLMDTIERIKLKVNPLLKVAGVITTMMHPRRAINREVLADLEKHFPGRVLKTRIRVNVRLVEAPSQGKTIFDHAPESNGAVDYMNLSQEVLARLPLPALKPIDALADLFPEDAAAPPAPVEAAVAEAPAAETPAADPIAQVFEAPAPEAVVEAPAVETQSVEAPVAETPAPEAAVETPVAEAPPVEAPVAEAPAPEAVVEAHAVEAPVVETQTAEAPVAETPAPEAAVETPVAEAPSVEAPVADAPAPEAAVEAPVVETQTVEAPVAETPAPEAAVETPVAEAPSVEAPVADAPAPEAAVEAPVVETQTVEAPVAETPAPEAAIEAPVAEAPPVEAPVVEAPAPEAAVEEPVAEAPVMAEGLVDASARLAEPSAELPAPEAPAVAEPAAVAPDTVILTPASETLEALPVSREEEEVISADSRYVPLPADVPLTTPVQEPTPSQAAVETPSAYVALPPGAPATTPVNSLGKTKFAQNFGMGGLKPIVTSKPGAAAPAPAAKKESFTGRLFGKLLGRKG